LAECIVTIVGRQSEGSLIRGYNPNPIPDPNPISNHKSYRRVISRRKVRY